MITDDAIECMLLEISTRSYPSLFSVFQELPDNEIFCPPITIRAVDCRNFGRYVLVGTHVINNMSKFMYIPTTKTSKEATRKFQTGR